MLAADSHIDSINIALVGMFLMTLICAQAHKLRGASQAIKMVHCLPVDHVMPHCP